MGSKRTMLLNGLGTLLKNEMPQHDRVVDLFCGAGSVSWFAATEGDRPVLSVDLQKYATTLAGAVTLRTNEVEPEQLIRYWIKVAKGKAIEHPLWKPALAIDEGGLNTATWCKRARAFCDEVRGEKAGLVLRSYGGYYFCPTQAILFDCFLEHLPRNARGIGLAATIITASQCAASPGHTAQPFRPTRTAGPFLREAWQRDPAMYAERAVRFLCTMYERKKGETIVGDAADVDHDVERRFMVGELQRLAHDHAAGLAGEEFVDGLLVHDEFSRALLDEHAGHGALAPSGAVVIVADHGLP